MSAKKVPAKKVPAKKVLPIAKSNIKRSSKREANKIVADLLSEIVHNADIKSNRSMFTRLLNVSLTRPAWSRISLTRPAWSRISSTRPAWSRISSTRPAWLKFSIALIRAWLKFSFTRPTWSRISLTRPTWSRISLTRPTWSRISLTRPTWSRISLTRPALSRSLFTRPKRLADQSSDSQGAKNSLPLIVVAAVVALIVAGFWGPQIVRKIGIPIDPEPFTAVYFQDPTIVQTGIVSGDLVVFGVHNGFRDLRNLTWRMESEKTTLSRGQILVNANSDSFIAVSTSGALPGGVLKIYIEGTETPITIQVVG
jgi:hypothetical protein